MCIAIVTKPGMVLDTFTFRRCWNINPHGFGMAWVNAIDGNVEIDKGYMAVDHAVKQYFRLAEERKNADRYMLLHFRAATVGGVSADNCHPFKVKGGAMIHNGTFWHDNKATKSDSRQLAEMMHNELHHANLTVNKDLFQKAFGYNRVAFLFKDNKPVIFSEEFNSAKGQFGQWRDGVWYSNGGWKGAYNGYYGDGVKAGAGAGLYDMDDDVALQQLDDWMNGRRNPNAA